MEPRDVVQAAIDAYHAHDLDRCMSFHAPDVVVKRADGTIMMGGAETVRARYAKSLSDHPNLHYDIPNRIALGPYVIDEERVTGYSKGGPVEEIAREAAVAPQTIYAAFGTKLRLAQAMVDAGFPHVQEAFGRPGTRVSGPSRLAAHLRDDAAAHLRVLRRPARVGRSQPHRPVR